MDAVVGFAIVTCVAVPVVSGVVGVVVVGVMVVVIPGVVVTGVVDSCGVVFRDDCSCGCRCYGCG